MARACESDKDTNFRRKRDAESSSSLASPRSLAPTGLSAMPPILAGRNGIGFDEIRNGFRRDTDCPAAVDAGQFALCQPCTNRCDLQAKRVSGFFNRQQCCHLKSSVVLRRSITVSHVLPWMSNSYTYYEVIRYTNCLWPLRCLQLDKPSRQVYLGR